MLKAAAKGMWMHYIWRSIAVAAGGGAAGSGRDRAAFALVGRARLSAPEAKAKPHAAGTDRRKWLHKLIFFSFLL
ncbi:hypothetical protein EVAR_67894_1 [Eumeta japonica]|uniref:Uncharacterized protein n=1 Tax=Eumeta variegata TaxID=151549 RepID=A0A4C1YX32_EUMVA|nr:hypothetical protein EVAR_67894_1 [Eumeta japonica]